MNRSKSIIVVYKLMYCTTFDQIRIGSLIYEPEIDNQLIFDI